MKYVLMTVILKDDGTTERRDRRRDSTSVIRPMGGRRAGLITAGAIPSSVSYVYNGMRNRRKMPPDAANPMKTLKGIRHNDSEFLKCAS